MLEDDIVKLFNEFKFNNWGRSLKVKLPLWCLSQKLRMIQSVQPVLIHEVKTARDLDLSLQSIKESVKAGKQP